MTPTSTAFPSMRFKRDELLAALEARMEWAQKLDAKHSSNASTTGRTSRVEVLWSNQPFDRGQLWTEATA